MRKHVLIVDDLEPMRDSIELALGAAGYATVGVGDGFSALKELDRRVPDLIILDLRLPELSGADVLRVLRATPEWKDIPVLVVTGLALLPKDAELLRKGPTMCVDKPVAAETLIRSVAQLLDAGTPAPVPPCDRATAPTPDHAARDDVPHNLQRHGRIRVPLSTSGRQRLRRPVG